MFGSRPEPTKQMLGGPLQALFSTHNGSEVSRLTGNGAHLAVLGCMILYSLLMLDSMVDKDGQKSESEVE